MFFWHESLLFVSPAWCDDGKLLWFLSGQTDLKLREATFYGAIFFFGVNLNLLIFFSSFLSRKCDFNFSFLFSNIKFPTIQSRWRVVWMFVRPTMCVCVCKWPFGDLVLFSACCCIIYDHSFLRSTHSYSFTFFSLYSEFSLKFIWRRVFQTMKEGRDNLHEDRGRERVKGSMLKTATCHINWNSIERESILHRVGDVIRC